ncbi:sensor histidine kinase [Caenimonas koreensis]|uniref:sensor histidine kinase n=1 Tax=Caenimonas koreensis TaxID=367474 RepID=UPI003784E90E
MADLPAPAAASDASAAAQALAVLHEQADAMRADLAALRQDLAQVESDFAQSPGVLMRQANEQLVLAAMRAEALAEAATSQLGKLSQAAALSGLDARPHGAPALVLAGEQNMLRLRQANEQLVIAALNSKAMESTALEAHHRQIAFLATVAHELRNPLMPLRLAALMLDRARTDDVAHAKLQATIKGQVAQMARLIGDLLDGSRITTGKFRLERTLIDVCDVMMQVIETCQPSMDEHGHHFTTDIPAGPVMMLGDTVRLVQIFGTLLENSSKYTPAGGVISLRMAVRGDAVIIVIADNGIGITARALPHVFDMFVRDAHATAVNEGGLGIGLAVVRELVTAHEGLVTAVSKGQGLGSEFTVTLPLAPLHPKPG